MYLIKKVNPCRYEHDMALIGSDSIQSDMFFVDGKNVTKKMNRFLPIESMGLLYLQNGSLWGGGVNLVQKSS